MSDRLAIKAGQQSRLRVQFTDASGDPIEATSVTVDFFDPDQNPDTDTAVVSGQVPTYLGNGIFELIFTAPSTPEGSWADRWTGTVLGTETVATLSFSLIASGLILSYPVQGVRENTLIEVVLSSDITSTSGTQLDEEANFFYSTTLTPFYSSVRKVKLDAGGMLGNIDDFTISLSILEASIESDVYSFFTGGTWNSNLFQHARRQYVTCLAARNLAGNILANGGVLKSKALADFKVDYDTGIIANLLRRLDDCVDKWMGQLQTGGGSMANNRPRMVIKGELDPDRVTAGRLWYGVQKGEIPGANTKYRNIGSRRWRSGWVRRGTGGSKWEW